MDDIYKNLEVYNPNRQRIMLISFDGIIADMFINKKLNRILTELFNRGRELNVYLAFIT